MFGNKKETENMSVTSSSSVSNSGTNSLVQGTSLEGVLNAGSDIRIDGQLKGTLICSGRLIIGATGVVDGEVNCQNAIIEGRFTGKLNVKELLNIKDSANVSGDIQTDKLLVESGATFNVNCDMGGQKIKSKSATKAVSA